MDIIDNKTDQEVLESLIAESAKATNEIRSAQGDLAKASNRLKFVLMLAHKLIDRKKD